MTDSGLPKLKLTKTELLNWLRGRKSTRAVGVCSSPEHCVLATYLNHRSGRRVWNVASDSAIRCGSRADTEYALPAWASTLVTRYDSLEYEGDSPIKPTPVVVKKLVHRA